jgi:hypothetical protein
MRKLFAFALGLTVVVVGATVATADHTGDGAFEFTVAIDEDGDRHAENPALDLRYERELLGKVATLDAPAGWVDGDRMGYTCGYSFLVYRDTVVGRVTVRKFRDPDDPGNAYIEVQDKHMHEGALNFDGTVPVEGNIAGGGEPTPDDGKSCALSDGRKGTAAEGYDPLQGTGDVPVVTFQHGPHAIDVRDFADELDVAVNDPTVVFDLVSATDDEVVIVAYQDEGELPVASIYYELVPDLAQGVAVGETVPGTQHHVSLHVGCGLDCVHAHEPDPTPEPTTDPEPTPTEAPTTDPSPTPTPQPATHLDCPVVASPVAGERVTCTFR